MPRIVASAFAILLALCAAPSSGAASPESAERVATSDVRLTLKVSGCDGCHIHPAAIQPRGNDFSEWSGAEKTVNDGEVTFRVPSNRTPWMYLEIRPKTPSGVYSSQTLVAMRYEGYDVGAPVSRAQASSGERAFGCWAGTKDRAVTMKMVVTRFQATSIDGQETGPHIRAFMSRGKKTVGSASSTFNGSLGTQDPYICHF